MAQGQVKKPQKQANSKPSGKPTGVTKKGSRSIAPKRAKLQKQAKMNKKLTSGLTAQTERMLSEKAGHMEMIGKAKDKKGNPGDGKKRGKKG